MTRYEYKVIPAPKRGEKQRGARHVEDRFAQTLASLMNKLGREGWEYQRAETLPVEERSGLTGRSTSFQNMLIFRRPLEAAAETETDNASETAPLILPEPTAVAGTARAEGPRLVSSRDNGGKAPALGPAKGEQPAE